MKIKSRLKLELTTADLLEIASLQQETSDPSCNENFHYDTETFLNVFRLRSGRIKVPFSFLYRVYRFWSLSPQNKTTLGRSLRAKFAIVRGKHETYYLLGNSFRSSFSGDSNKGRAKRKKTKPKL